VLSVSVFVLLARQRSSFLQICDYFCPVFRAAVCVVMLVDVGLLYRVTRHLNLLIDALHHNLTPDFGASVSASTSPCAARQASPFLAHDRRTVA
jgi:hypothetical protein